jgi:transcriptional regulator with XRE-family HTH domain
MRLELDIGAKIKARRQGHRQTLEYLAEKAGGISAFLSQIEHVKVSPSIASLKNTADALRAKITDFFVESKSEMKISTIITVHRRPTTGPIRDRSGPCRFG